MRIIVSWAFILTYILLLLLLACMTLNNSTILQLICRTCSVAACTEIYSENYSIMGLHLDLRIVIIIIGIYRAPFLRKIKQCCTTINTTQSFKHTELNYSKNYKLKEYDLHYLDTMTPKFGLQLAKTCNIHGFLFCDYGMILNPYP